MAIQDTDPERRNLIVTSLAFIAYFYAGGSFPETSIRLQVVNADFSKPEVLGNIAWAVFAWFIYRYWLTHRRSFVSHFGSEFTEWQNKHYITKFVNRHFDQEIFPNETTEEYRAVGIIWKNWRVILTCDYKRNKRDGRGNLMSSATVAGNQKDTEYIELTTAKGWVIAIRATMGCILTRPSFSNYAVPYIMAAIALYGALYRVTD